MHRDLVAQVLAGVSDKALGGRTKARRTAGRTAPASRGAVTPVTLGTTTKKTGKFFFVFFF